jgi:hypothetical protein
MSIKSKIYKPYSLQMGGENQKLFDPSHLSQEEKMKLEQGKPLMPMPGVKITKNPITGKLEGVP